MEGAGRGGEASHASLGPVHASFPAAGQPDAVRASRKDDYFVQELRERLLELARASLGPRTTIALNEELSLASGLLYHGLTTGCGVPTLGDEYCSLHLVAGEAQRPLSATRRALLVALQCCVPYLLQRERYAPAAQPPRAVHALTRCADGSPRAPPPCPRRRLPSCNLLAQRSLPR